eukprot:7989529-Karenia_brevis.AAC.1
MPWQRPGLLGHAVGGQPLFDGPFSAMRLREISQLRPPAVPKPQPAQPEPQVETMPPKKIKVSQAQEEDSRRKRLVDSWAKIVGMDLKASSVGRQ